MLIYLVRHAIAEARDSERWPDDALRPLTQTGRRRFTEAARGLQRLAPAIDRLLTSPYVRARETAEILERTAAWPLAQRCDELMPGFEPAAVAAVLRRDPVQAVALVGHEPGLSELASWLLTGDPMELAITFKKGGVLALSVQGAPGPAACSLEWSLPPRALRRFGA